MSFRARIALLLVGILAAVSGLTMVLLLGLSTEQLVRELGNKLTAIATAVALALPGDEIDGLRSPAAMSSAEFLRLRGYLRAVMRANREQGIDDLYVMRRSGSDTALEFVIDADETSQGQPLGATYDTRQAPVMLRGFEGPVSETKFTADRFGVTISAYAPVRDGKGRVVAILGVDARTDSLDQMRRGFYSHIAAALAVGFALAILGAIWAARSIAQPIESLIRGTREVAKGNFGARFEIYSPQEFVSIAAACNQMVSGLRERDAIKDTFRRYVSHDVAEKILLAPSQVGLQGELKNVSILFSDVRGFTTLAEQMAPEQVLELLNEYFAEMIEVLFAHEGTLDKFIGDNLMAIFGAPITRPDDPERAVRCAIAMLQGAGRISQKRRAAGRPDVHLGMGINTGAVVAGNIGSERRTEYSVIGDTVNLAARVQAKAGPDQLLISESTHYFVRDLVEAVAWDPIQVKGRVEPVSLFHVLGVRKRAAGGELERRRHLRAATLLGVRRESPSGGPVLEESASVSAGGAALLSAEPIDALSRMSLELSLPDAPLRVRARLVDSSELDAVSPVHRFVHRLAFEELADADRDRLSRFVYERTPSDQAVGFEKASEG